MLDKINKESYKLISFFQTIRLQNSFKTFNTHPLPCYRYYSTAFYLLNLKDGRLASTSEERTTLKIYSKDTFEPQISINKHSDIIYQIIQLNNDNILTCSRDNTMNIIKLINDNNYSLEQKLTGHSSYIFRAIEIRNNELISVSNDKTMKIWNLNNNNKYECINTINFQNSNSSCNILKINENEFVTYSYGDKYLKFWKSNNYSNISTIDNINVTFNSTWNSPPPLCKLDDDILCIVGDCIYLIKISTHQLIKNITDSKKIYSIYKCLDRLFLCLVHEKGNRSLIKYKYRNQNLIKIIEKENVNTNSDSISIELNGEIIVSVHYMMGHFLLLWRS